MEGRKLLPNMLGTKIIIAAGDSRNFVPVVNRSSMSMPAMDLKLLNFLSIVVKAAGELPISGILASLKMTGHRMLEFVRALKMAQNLPQATPWTCGQIASILGQVIKTPKFVGDLKIEVPMRGRNHVVLRILPSL